MPELGPYGSVRGARGNSRPYLGNAGWPVLPVEGIRLDVIQAPKPEPRIMRYELTDFEWAARNLIERFFNEIKQCRRVATDMTGSRPAIWPSSISLQSAFGCVPMSPRR